MKEFSGAPPHEISGKTKRYKFNNINLANWNNQEEPTIFKFESYRYVIEYKYEYLDEKRYEFTDMTLTDKKYETDINCNFFQDAREHNVELQVDLKQIASLLKIEFPSEFTEFIDDSVICLNTGRKLWEKFYYIKNEPLSKSGVLLEKYLNQIIEALQLKDFAQKHIKYYEYYSNDQKFDSSLIHSDRFPIYFDQRVDPHRMYLIKKLLNSIFAIDDVFISIIHEHYIKIEILVNDRLINICNLSTGIEKVIRLVICLSARIPWNSQDFKYNYEIPLHILIEEPENSLHPKLQSKLADLFVSLINIRNLKLVDSDLPSYVIETHSEYFIRKLQYLVATNKVDSKKISIYYFHDAFNGDDAEPKLIEIQSDGSLSSEFGSGFFDQAGNIAIELFKLNSEHHN